VTTSRAQSHRSLPLRSRSLLHACLCCALLAALSLSGCRAPELFKAPPNAAENKPVDRTELGKVTWHRDMRPLVETRCWPCHKTGDIAPFPIETYAQAHKLHPLIGHSVRTNSMPPWQAGPCCRPYRFDTSLTPKEKAVVKAWVQQGAPEGDVADYKAPAKTTDGGLSRVDLALKGPTYTPSAKFGTDELRCFLLDVPDAPLFVTGFNVRPGNAKVVHHVLLNVINKDYVAHFQGLDDNDSGPGWDCFGQGLSAAHGAGIGGWAPGFRGLDYPDGLGIKVPAGAKLLMAVHYDLSGGGGADASTAQFSTAKTVQREVTNMGFSHPLWLIGDGMKIAAGDKDAVRTFAYDPTSSVGENGPLNVYAVNIHMHERGTRASLVIDRLDGERECLLYIPSYDFDWQQTYFLEKPATLKPGDLLYLECHWDNTDSNQPIKGGKKAKAQDQWWGTDKEMCTAFVMMAKP